jgi:hypothetical protein
MRRGLIAVLLGLPLCALLLGASGDTPAVWVGSQACASCHADQTERWQRSHHARAMQPATSQTVVAEFGSTDRPVRFELAGQLTEFLRRGDQYLVRTEDAGGHRHDHVISHTIGLHPLQQYLITMPDGRLQTLGVAWDTRPRSDGGQRWFHLYADSPPRPGEPTHWSGREQTWNVMCASCHVTGWRKGFDAASGSYRSTWSEPGVGCEACHGPGSRHVAWARDQSRGRPSGQDPTRGFERPITALQPPAFAFQTGTARPIAVNQGTVAQGQAAGEVCWGCHARRSELVAPLQPGAHFLDQYRPSLIEPGLYLPDGRIDGEVFEYGAFVQSAMHRAGVTCTHCHDSHDGTLRATGNTLCGTCHQPAHYDRPAHPEHRQRDDPTTCTACHMPTRIYMGVHARHDHSLRIPGLAVPADSWSGRSPFAQASALAASANPDRNALDTARRAHDGLLRLGAAQALARLPPPEAISLGLPLLADPLRAVRLEAARSLIRVPAHLWPANASTVRDAAVAELLSAEQLSSDRPEGQLNVAALLSALGRNDQAERWLDRTLGQSPDFVPAYINLADVYRRQGRDTSAEENLLREAVRRAPHVAEPAHALGLWLVRARRFEEALPWLEEAETLLPGNAMLQQTLALLRQHLAVQTQPASSPPR